MDWLNWSSSSLERAGLFLFAWRNWIFTAGLIALLAGFHPVPFLGNWSWDLWLDMLGFAITLLGQAVRILVVGYTPIHSGGRKKKLSAECLLTSGMLNHVRNPLYIANLLVITGLALIHNNPWVYAMAIPTTIFSYVAIVAAEEAYLVRRFGEEYKEYYRRVPRWLPRLSGMQDSLQATKFDRRRVLLQEYGSIWIAVALPLVLMLYEQWSQPPSPTRETWIQVLGILLVLVTATWAWLRRIKCAVVVRREALVKAARQNASAVHGEK